MSPRAIYLLRFDILAVCVLAVWAVRRPSLKGLSAKQWAAAVVMGLVAVPVYQLLFTGGSKGVGSALIGTLVATSPVHVSWMATLLLGERFAWRQAAAVGLALGGALVPVVARGGFEVQAVAYVAMIAAMPLISAGHTVFMRGMAKYARSSWDLVSVMYIVAILFSQPLMDGGVWQEWKALSFEGWAAGFYLATLGQLVPMTLWVMALRRLPATTVAVYQFVLMSLAGIWGWIIMGEALGWVDVVGMTLVTVGLVINARRTPIGRSRAPILE
jgi:drug/metabolite transporter (DMT)-like permease